MSEMKHKSFIAAVIFALVLIAEPILGSGPVTYPGYYEPWAEGDHYFTNTCIGSSHNCNPNPTQPWYQIAGGSTGCGFSCVDIGRALNPCTGLGESTTGVSTNGVTLSSTTGTVGNLGQSENSYTPTATTPWEFDMVVCAYRVCSPCTGTSLGGGIGSVSPAFFNYLVEWRSATTGLRVVAQATGLPSGTTTSGSCITDTTSLTSNIVTVQIVWTYDGASTVKVVASGYTSCTYTCPSNCFTLPFGFVTTAAANIHGRNLVCTGTPSVCDGGSIENFIWNPNNGHTFTLSGSNVTAEEFDSGLSGFATSLGFITTESKTFFSLIIIAVTEIVMAFFVGFFGEGRWKIWTIHGIACLAGVFCVLMGWLQFWMLLCAMVVATTTMSGGRELINTFKKLSFKGPAPKIGLGLIGRPVAVSDGGEEIDVAEESVAADEDRERAAFVEGEEDDENDSNGDRAK